MTDIEIARARALCEAATRGPWIQDPSDTSYVRLGPEGWTTVASVNLNHHDAAFIAAARSLVPDLLDENERLLAGLIYMLDTSLDHAIDVNRLIELRKLVTP